MTNRPTSTFPLPGDIEAAIARIASDYKQGARSLARAAASVLELACQTPPSDAAIQTVHATARRLADSRPSMAAIANTAARIWSAGLSSTQEASGGGRLRAMANEAQRLQRYWGEIDPKFTLRAQPFLGGTLYTHSRSGTVEAVLLALARSSAEQRRIVVGESRPGGEGVGLAQLLAAAGWDVTLVADSACGLRIARVDAVVIGADSIRSDGSVVNKVGSYPLALVACANSKPLYVVSESLKIAPPELPLQLESLPPETLVDGTIAGVTVDAVAFDVTPSDLIASVITEDGILTLPEIQRLSDAASLAYHALYGAPMSTEP